MREMKLQDLKSKTPAELVAFAEEHQVENASTMRKQELMFAILKQLATQEVYIIGEGVVEVLSDGFGFLRSPESNYLSGPDDIYVSPSLADGSSVSLLEAMSCGLPSVVYPVGGNPEWVDSDVGWVCSAVTSKALAQAMLAALTSKSRWIQLGTRARERVRRKARFSENTLHLENAYRFAVGGAFDVHRRQPGEGPA